jgi:hypothetical protein
MNFVLPSKREVGVLNNSDLAKEWSGDHKVILSDGQEVQWNPPPPKPVMPDWSEIKTIRHYFNRTGFRPFPAWLYHPTEQPCIVKDANEAADLGVCYREATVEERSKYGKQQVWDWQDDSEWRPEPWPGTMKFNPNKMEQGKTYVPTPVAQSTANRELLNTVLPEVTAAVVAALKQGGSVAPDKIDGKQWDEFLAFQAWKKTQEAIDGITPPSDAEKANSALAALSDERAAWIAEAERKGVKVDKRWSLDRLKSEVEKAA